MRVVLGALTLALVAAAGPAVASQHGGRPPTLDAEPTAASRAAAGTADRRALPTLTVRRQVRNLQNPWDVQAIGDGRLLVTERDTAHLILWEDGAKSRVRFPSGKIWVSGETGLMSMEVDPGFSDNRRFYTCSGWIKPGGGHDIRINAWRLSANGERARRVETLLAGLPTSSGRHGGCRLLIGRSGSLLVGTGDAAVGTNPRNLRSLGGKTLRLDRKSGAPWPTNTWVDAANRHKRYVHTYGHRNIQGLAQRRDGTLWSVEHGSFRDDEVNRLRSGGDYGWHPVPGYNETVPMTDFSLPGKQYAARWKSGDPTLATSGAAWVYGNRWGRLDGTLAVAALKASRVVFMKFDSSGRLKWTRAPMKLRQYGRLRSVTVAPDGDLLITSDNDSGDVVIRVSPAG